MKIITTASELNIAIAEAKKIGDVGFVPTMGALHAGHISLVKQCCKENKTVVTSVFVNPTQFNDKSDLANYPRTLEQDAKILEESGCNIMFAPTVEQIYPEEDTRLFDFGTLEQVMEGPLRPGHFNGVAQVVSRLFELVKPHRAYFGEKDFQQLAIIRELVKQLSIDIEIVGCEIIRDSDGLALSSRNQLLSKEQRQVAPVIYLTICEARKIAEVADLEFTKKWVKEQIESCADMELDYFEIVDSTTLQPVESLDMNCSTRACVAVKVGNIRLIDNIAF
ncbi:MAG: pantoate--beta-alanine ligase [Rikenellaceae bacterium]